MTSVRLFISILRFGQPHKKYLWGILFSFVAAVLSGVSLTAFVPLFDAVVSKQDIFIWPLDAQEKKILSKVLRQSSENVEEEIASLAIEYQMLDWQRSSEILSTTELLRLRSMIAVKMWVNRFELSPFEFILWISFLIFFLILTKTLSLLVAIRFLGFWGYRLIRDLRNFLIIQILYKIPLPAYTQSQAGLFMSRMGVDVEYIANVVANESRDVITNIFYLLVYAFILAFLNTKLFLFCMIILPFVFFPTNFLIKKIQKASSQGYKLMTELHNIVKETISGIRIIRLYQTLEKESKEFAEHSNTFYWRWFKRNLYEKATPSIVEFTSVLLVVLVFALGGGTLATVGENFGSGSFIAFVLVLASCIRPVMQIASMFGKVQNAIIGGRRVFLHGHPTSADYDSVFPLYPDPKPHPTPKAKMMREKASSTAFTGAAPLPNSTASFQDKIEFKNVSFQYTSQERQTQVLENVSWEICRGDRIEILGMSGAGKSTIFDLIMRFLEPAAGSIQLDGRSIQDLDMDAYRNLFGLAQQESFLFQGSIRDNIAFGKKSGTVTNDHDIQEAARLAFADVFIKDLPEGYDTDVGNRGLQLSGGQRQRLALARLLLRDPAIILLDEATSALDRLTLEEIVTSIESLDQGKTVIQISHHSLETKKGWKSYRLEQGKLYLAK